jgi:hypothetical protein
MSEIKYTPGPWFDRVFLEIRTSEYEYGGEQIGDVCSSKYIDGHEDNPVAEANARLIAAAPELLESLTDIVEFIDREGPAAKAWEAISAACEKAGLVIAKATGSQS